MRRKSLALSGSDIGTPLSTRQPTVRCCTHHAPPGERAVRQFWRVIPDATRARVETRGGLGLHKGRSFLGFATMASFSFAETFAITALTSVVTLSGVVIQAQVSARQFRQAQAEARLTASRERRDAQIDKALETQREALDQMQRIGGELPWLAADLCGTGHHDESDLRAFFKTLSDFELWASRIEDEDTHDAAFEFVGACQDTIDSDPNQNRMAAAARLRGLWDRVNYTAGDQIRQLPLYALPTTDVTSLG
jgi:hypothetical protein